MQPTANATAPSDGQGRYLMARAELYHCLGQAFVPPMDPAYHQAMTDALPADLDELVPGKGAGAALASSMAATADHQSLLRAYSRLFLVPPRPAPLNAGAYIDGTIMGPSVVEMERYYQRHGLVRDADFRGMPDHLVLQLQFLAALLGTAAQMDSARATSVLQEARDFLNRFLRPWPNDLLQRLDHQSSRDARCRPYAVLGRLVRDALDEDARWLQSRVPAPAPHAAEPDVNESRGAAREAAFGEQSHCGHCGNPFAASAELAGMIRILEEKGLDAGHLSVCPDCRAETMGLKATKPHFKELPSETGS